MSLQSGISDLASRIAQEFKAIRIVPTRVLQASTGSATITSDASTGQNVRTYAASSGAAVVIGEPTNGSDGQVIRYRIYPSSGSCTVEIASTIRKTQGLTRGPHTVAAGEIAILALEYVGPGSLTNPPNDWVLTAFTITEA
jgi:hypothetical protein